MLALVNTHSAAAIQYGYDRDFQAGEQTVLLLDVGASSTEAALVRFSTFNSSAARTHGYACLLHAHACMQSPTHRGCLLTRMLACCSTCCVLGTATRPCGPALAEASLVQALLGEAVGPEVRADDVLGAP